MKAVIAFGTVMLGAALAMAETPASQPAKLHVGLRRSSYGGKHHADNAWWVGRTKEFASHFPDAKPTIIEIVSTYQEDGTTQFEFAKPDDYAGSTRGMAFRKGKVLHDQALDEYDKQGISAVLQVEPGNANLKACLEVVHRKFGKHPCVIGLGVDAEWFFAKESDKQEGRPITDEEAKELVEAVVDLNPKYTLFLKHFSVKHMPPGFRHPNLYFVNDSQQFTSADGMLGDFKRWGTHFKDSATGYQFGYPDDKEWWSKLTSPPVNLSERIRATVPSCGYLFWVDFTADQVEFK